MVELFCIARPAKGASKRKVIIQNSLKDIGTFWCKSKKYPTFDDYRKATTSPTFNSMHIEYARVEANGNLFWTNEPNLATKWEHDKAEVELLALELVTEKQLHLFLVRAEKEEV